MRRRRKEVGDLRGLVDRKRAKVAVLRGEREKLVRMCKHRDDQIYNLKHEIAEVHGSYQGVMEGQIQQSRVMQARLKQTEELLETRSAELSGAHAFLSTADRLSEIDMSNAVHDLNYQVAVGLAEEWEKLDPEQATRALWT